MSAPRVIHEFPSDDGTSIASTEAFQMEVENLFTSSPSTKWQTTGVGTAEDVTVDLGSAQSIQFFALLGHDFDDTETSVEIVGNSAAAWGAPAFTQTITYRENTFVEFFSAAQSYRYWRFRFAKANAADLRSAGRLLLGPYVELLRPPSRGGYSWGWNDTTTTAQTRGGVRYSDIGARTRTLRMSMPAAPESQADLLNTIANTNGRGIPFVVSIDHDNHPLDWFMYGTFGNLVGQRYEAPAASGGHLWALTMDMEEVV